MKGSEPLGKPEVAPRAWPAPSPARPVGWTPGRSGCAPAGECLARPSGPGGGGTGPGVLVGQAALRHPVLRPKGALEVSRHLGAPWLKVGSLVLGACRRTGGRCGSTASPRAARGLKRTTSDRTSWSIFRSNWRRGIEVMRVGFLGMLLAVVLFGVGVGAAFAAGQASSRLASPAAAAGAPNVSAGQGGAAQGRASQGGAFQGGSGGGQGQADSQGVRGAGTTGTVAAVREGAVLLRTPQGDATVQVTPETAVRRTVEASLQDLKAGDRVTVMGERSDGGNITARAIQILAAEESGGAAPEAETRRPARP